MERPRICAALVDDDVLAARSVEAMVDLFEVRIDLIGDGWRRLVTQLKKPWIACNRTAAEGGNWRGSESSRIEELLGAVELGAAIVDIELNTPGLPEVVKSIAKRAQRLVSFHDLEGTPPLDTMRQMVHREIEAGADICKVVTTARRFEDNIAVLRLVADFSESRIVSFAMGPLGVISRVLCPLVGGDFIYASVAEGKESASGQMTVANLRKIYGMLKGE